MISSSNYRTSTKSNSYIFAIENNSIPIYYEPIIENNGGRNLLIPQQQQKKRKRGYLTLDDLNNYRSNSKWKVKRWLFYSIFWFGWIFSILFAIILTLSHPKCDFKIREWWKDSIIYEIWTLSFSDSNSDTFGDLNGIISKLDYLKHIGVNTIFLRQIIRMESTGLGVIEYNQLTNKLGSFEQFSELIRISHQKGIRILIDFPLVITSIANPWFKKSALASANPEDVNFADFFIWRRNIPNSKFISEYNGSILKYFHFYKRPDLPILDWRNKNVSNIIKKALAFWINKGIDGFHFSSIEYLHRSNDGKNPNWEGIAKILSSLRRFIDEERRNIGKEKMFLFASHSHLSEYSKHLLIQNASLNLIVNTELQSLDIKNLICKNNNKTSSSIGECSNEIIADLLMFHNKEEENEEDRVKVWTVWSYGSPFTSRLATRVGSRVLAEMLIQLILVLPGTSLLYYGDELGQKDLSRGKFPQRGPLIDLNKDDYQEENNILRNFIRLINLRKYSKSLKNGHVYITKPIKNDAYLIYRWINNGRIKRFYGEV